MRQHPNTNPDKNEDDLEELGTPFYQGNGLSVRALTAEELQRFLDAHAGQSAELLGSGWATMDPPGHPLAVPSTPPGAEPEPPEPQPALPAQQATGSLGYPGRSALTQYRRRRATELAAWTRSLTWRAPLVMAAGLTVGALAGQADLLGAGLAGLAGAALVGWRLRFRPSSQACAWQRGAKGERRTARRLDRLGREGYVIFHDLAMPDSPANLDHLVVGPSGCS
jgi:Nuclease-related domain